LEGLEAAQTQNDDAEVLVRQHAIAAIADSGGGSIVNVSSTLGIKGGASFPAYSASKGAVRMLTKSVALRCAEQGYNIRCNSVHPGPVDTEMFRNAFADPDDLAKRLSRVPKIGRAHV